MKLMQICTISKGFVSLIVIHNNSRPQTKIHEAEIKEYIENNFVIYIFMKTLVIFDKL